MKVAAGNTRLCCVDDKAASGVQCTSLTVHMASLCAAMQLLINIPFQNKCKLQTLVIKGPADTGPKVGTTLPHLANSNRVLVVSGTLRNLQCGQEASLQATAWCLEVPDCMANMGLLDPVWSTQVVKLWANRPSMGFSDVNTPCIQEFSLTADQVAAGAQLTLKLVKFNSTFSHSDACLFVPVVLAQCAPVSAA